MAEPAGAALPAAGERFSPPNPISSSIRLSLLHARRALLVPRSRSPRLCARYAQLERPQVSAAPKLPFVTVCVHNGDARLSLA